ncbi:MFS transporter [Chloroflexota bacterium]
MQSNLKRPAIFYGWWIVGACFIINTCASGAVFFGFTAFFEPIASEFGWSYAQVSLAASLRGLELGIVAPLAGLAVDRYGPRRLVFAGAIVMGIGITILGQVNNLAMFYAAFIVISIGMGVCMGVVTMTAVANWFRRKSSIALGISMSGTAVGGTLIPLATFLIDDLGWRMAILGLGLSTSAIILILSLFLRHKPEQYGYLPDGGDGSFEALNLEITAAQLSETEPKMTPLQVLSNRTFWHITLAYVLNFLGVTAVLTHVMPYLSTLNITRSTSSLLASAVPVVTIFGRIGFGWLGDRFDKRFLGVITHAAIGLGLLFFGGIAIGGIWFSVPFIICISIGWGGSATNMPGLVREYFGRSSFGTVLGFLMGISWVGQVMGPFLAGWVFDTWGSYLGAWFGCAILLMIATIIMATTPPTDISLQMAERR